MAGRRKSADLPEIAKHRLALDGPWTLLELGEFPRRYLQVYSVLYSFYLIESEDTDRADRVQHAYEAFPWRGGYSAVNFYESLRYATPPRHRPLVRSIRYSSPGWIELELCVQVAKQIAMLVGTVVASGLAINKLYHTIYKQAQERKLLRVRVASEQIRLAEQHHAFIDRSARQLSDAMGFERLDELNSLTPDRLRSLKILLSLFRRVRDLAKLQRKGRIEY